MEYREIKTNRDAVRFDRETNGLHDGYLVSVSYSHEGYTWGNPMHVDPQKTFLVLRIMVTSLRDTLVEMEFEGIRDFQIKETAYGLVDSSISITKDRLITWCGDNSTETDVLRDANYVIADKMKWRIIA